jgi:spermidine/putrescine transport system permease protein
MLLFLVILPFWTNFLVRIYGWKIILRHLELLGTEIAVLIGLTYIYLPFMILPLFSALERFDSRLYLAARDLGASGIQAIIKVVIPVIAPGVRVGILFVFVLTFGDFVVNDLLGGAKNAMIGSSIRDAYLVSRNWPLGAALTVLSTLFLLIFIWCIRKWRTSGT